jgi:hypothetical protein
MEKRMRKRKLKVPSLLRDVRLTALDMRALEPVMGNWIKVHGYLRSLKPYTWLTFEKARKVLLYELTHGKRPDVLHRVFRAVMVQANEIHEQELFNSYHS